MTHAGGRPSKYRPEMCEQVINWMYQGHSKTEVAYLLKISKETLYQWVKEYPEFSDAIKKGVNFAEGWWKINGTQNIDNKDFNSTLWYMNMKNRFGWADKQETSHSGEVSFRDNTSKARETLDE